MIKVTFPKGKKFLQWGLNKRPHNVKLTALPTVP